MADPIPQFTYLAKGLRELELAYLHVVEARISGSSDIEAREKVDFLVDLWGNTSPVFIAGGFTPYSALRAVEEYKDHDVAVVFGRYFISNPDLPFKVKKGIPLTPYNRETFYKVGSREGYTDYPISKEFEAARIQGYSRATQKARIA